MATLCSKKHESEHELEQQPPQKKQKLDTNVKYCKFECNRIVNPKLLTVCCDECHEGNKGILFNIEPYEHIDEMEHSYHCNCTQISIYDKHKHTQLDMNHKQHKFWSLFNHKRRYRPSAKSIRFFVDAQTLSNDELELNGMLVTDLYSLYIKCKHKLKQPTVDDFDNFFECCQFGDIIDIEQYRNTGAYVIGFSANHINNKNINELKFIKFWGEYGYGLPLEFGDVPKRYFEDVCQFHIFDPLSLGFMLNGNDKNNKERYYYVELMKDIERREKISPKCSNICEIELDKFPQEYIALIWDDDCDEFEFEWISKNIALKWVKDMMVDEWIKTFDLSVELRRKRIEQHLCSICNINSNILKVIVSFAV